MREYRELRAYYRALADTTRLRILGELGHQKQVAVSDLSLALGVTQPLVSWHLRILRRSHLIITRRQGRQVLCSLNKATVAEYEDRLRDVLNGAAARAELAVGGEVSLT